MKIGVVGSRSITAYTTVSNAIHDSPWFPDDVTTIVSGGADGVDSSAEYFAEEQTLDMRVITPDYDDWSDGHPAKVRNTRIVEESDTIVAVWDGHSTGTRDTIDKALDRGVPIYVEVPRS